MLNTMPAIRGDAEYVLVWLQQTLRGHEHPAIEVALEIARQRGVSVLVYHGLRCDYPYASRRLSRFILGASRAMGLTLRERGIVCRQLVQTSSEHGKGMVYRLAEKALCVVIDDHPTFVARAQADRFAASEHTPTLAVDATRLVPHSQLGGPLHVTKNFRAAHTAKREAWIGGCGDAGTVGSFPMADLPDELVELAAMSEADIDRLAASLPIDQNLVEVAHFPATRDAVKARLDSINEDFVRNYRWQRNNPAQPLGATMLSPYLHFGMVSPWEVVQRIEGSGAPRSYGYKLRDELLTWREWTHWRMTGRPDLLRYDTLPSWARKTLAAHADDPRNPLLDITQVLHGRTGDPVFDAAARCWLATGWLHNNLRMYWAKQVLRFMAGPEAAWAACCYINDRLSYDGRDPATYVSMRWAFGEARPGYRETAIYGLVMPKSPTAILKRAGMASWVKGWSTVDVSEVDCSNFYELKKAYL